MDNRQLQKDAGVMDYVDSAVSGGGRFLKDVYRDVISPAGRSLEKVTKTDVIDPAVRKVKSTLGPAWDELVDTGRSVKNSVIKGITGLSRFGGDAYNTARRLYHSAPVIRKDVSTAYNDLKGDLRSFMGRNRANYGNAEAELRKLINRYMDTSSSNISELGEDMQGTLGNAWESILRHANGGMQKSSSLQKEAWARPLLTFFKRMANNRRIRKARASKTNVLRNPDNPRKNLGTLPAWSNDKHYVYPGSYKPVDSRVKELFKDTEPAAAIQGTSTSPAITGINASGAAPNKALRELPPVQAPVTAAAPAGAVPAASAAGAVPAASAAGGIINNGSNIGVVMPSGAVPAAGAAAGGKANMVMNGLMLGGMGYSMLGGGGSAAAAQAAAPTVAAAVNPRMYLPQTSYVNWAADNNILKGLYM